MNHNVKTRDFNPITNNIWYLKFRPQNLVFDVVKWLPFKDPDEMLLFCRNYLMSDAFTPDTRCHFLPNIWPKKRTFSTHVNGRQLFATRDGSRERERELTTKRIKGRMVNYEDVDDEEDVDEHDDEIRRQRPR